MAKKRLTEDEYLAELNRQLQQHKDFRNGMAFLPWPQGATGKAMTGYHMAGRFENWDWVGIYAQVAHKVREECELAI